MFYYLCNKIPKLIVLFTINFKKQNINELFMKRPKSLFKQKKRTISGSFKLKNQTKLKINKIYQDNKKIKFPIIKHLKFGK